MDSSDDNSHASRGAKGGAIRAANLTPERKAAIAKKAAASRWQARGNKPNQVSVLIPVSTPNPRGPVQPIC